MKQSIFIFLLSILGMQSVIAQTSFKTDRFRLTLSAVGQLTEMTDPSTNKNYLALGEKAPLLKIRVGNEWEEPGRAVFNSKSASFWFLVPTTNATTTRLTGSNAIMIQAFPYSFNKHSSSVKFFSF